MAAETNVAVDEHENAWRVSKEGAEALFNDRRLAAEEDAQDAANGAESEIRINLRHIIAQVGWVAPRWRQKQDKSITGQIYG